VASIAMLGMRFMAFKGGNNSDPAAPRCCLLLPSTWNKVVSKGSSVEKQNNYSPVSTIISNLDKDF
jgi:hypothetical protein